DERKKEIFQEPSFSVFNNPLLFFNHAITNRKILNLKSRVEIKTSSSVFGQMLPKGVPIPPSAPSCRSSPGTPPSCPMAQPEIVDIVASFTP
uniref:Uncharacterized protein n=1 Tax=Solanum lycopersicum TaxID=4081 RepID=A0A3Q7HXQ6_SOLLC